MLKDLKNSLIQKEQHTFTVRTNSTDDSGGRFNPFPAPSGD